jgi:hypothetical protein
MTLLVGIRCVDGVVIAADQAVTFGTGPGRFTISHLACKVSVIADQVIVAGTGQVGLKQRFCETVEKLWASGQMKGKSPLEMARQISAAGVQDFGSTGANKGEFGALVAFPNKAGPSLFEFQIADMQPEMKDDGTWFVSMGSGQQIADSYLAFMRSVYWQNGAPTIRHALFAAAWVMQQSIAVAPGFISEPINIAVLQGGKAKKLTEAEVGIHMDAANAATKHFGTFDPDKPDQAAAVSATSAIPSPPTTA